MTLIIINCNDLTAMVLRMYIGATVSSVLMKVYTMFVLQSCTDCLHILPGSSGETLPTSSDGTYDGGNIKLEEDIGIKEEVEVNVETDIAVGSEEDECIGIIEGDGIYSEKANEEEKEDVDVKEEVSSEDAV